MKLEIELDLNKIDGKVYGLPVTTEGMGLVVNKAMFEAAGVDITTLDSFDKIEDAFATLQKAIDDGKLKDQSLLLHSLKTEVLPPAHHSLHKHREAKLQEAKNHLPLQVPMHDRPSSADE